MLNYVIVWTSPRTLMAAAWRALVAICDWRTHLRRLKEKPILDVVFVTNMRDNTDRKNFLGKLRPKHGHFNGPRYWLHGRIAGRTRALDITASDLATSEGRVKARNYFIRAVHWAQERGARVVLLAAGTKHLFDDPVLGNGAELKKMFPDIIFTIGDNGTILLLQEETLRALKEAKPKLDPKTCSVVVLGPHGLLGEQMVKMLQEHGYENIIGAGARTKELAQIKDRYGIKVRKIFAEMSKVDAVIACTHSEMIQLKADSIDLIRRPDKRLLVIDVAEPSNFKYREWRECQNRVVRQDAGNAYNENLNYVLGAFSYKLFRLSRGVTFGCFAEALSIYSALLRGEEVVA